MNGSSRSHSAILALSSTKSCGYPQVSTGGITSFFRGVFWYAMGRYSAASLVTLGFCDYRGTLLQVDMLVDGERTVWVWRVSPLSSVCISVRNAGSY